MERLPEVRDHPWGSRYGHRSADLPGETTPDWVQIDFGERHGVTMVALMPVNLSYRGNAGEGYGFPRRFRVEISDHPDMREATVLVDRGGEDVPNPGKYPLVFECGTAAGRYLRFTSLKHFPEDGTYFWALEELFVLRGNQPLAGKITHSSDLDLYPQWVAPRINDGQSALGMPVDVTIASPSHGYLSDRIGLGAAANTPPGTSLKWCAVDLGAPQEIDQVRVLPLESDEYEVVGGRGFPRLFSVQLSDEPDFSKVIWETRRGQFALGYPAGCAIQILVPRVKARYVRVLAEMMWSRDNWMVFGLSELQVYSGDRNVAMGKRGYAKDETRRSPGDGWAPGHLVDGYTSRYRLIEWPVYLRLMGQRGMLQMEKSVLEQRRSAILSFGQKVLNGLLVFALFLVLGAWLRGILRHRLLRRREIEQLRQQIARDLHDDIGSNLGGIVLLSEIGGEQSRDPESRRDFEAIRRAAEDASLSMRDIVWLIQREPIGLKDFVTRMRQSLRTILNHPDVRMEVEPAAFEDRPLGLFFRRHVFLAFKEVLNNVRKHAGTLRVTVKVEIRPDRLRFTVRDEGIGFDPEKPGGSGHGLGNLKRRAARVSGSVHIDSTPGKGTMVIFEAPFSTTHT